MFRDADDGHTNFYCGCNRPSYAHSIYNTCGGIEPPPADLIAEMRSFEVDHGPDGWPAVRMWQISALCDEADKARAAVSDAEKGRTMNQEPLPAQGPVDVNVGPDVPSAYRTFNGMCWAVPGQRMDDLEYRMRYAAKDAVFTMSERLTIASFLSAYREIVKLPQKERNERIKEIRQGPGAKVKK